MLSAGAVPVLTAQLLHPTSSDLLLRSNIASTLLQVRQCHGLGVGTRLPLTLGLGLCVSPHHLTCPAAHLPFTHLRTVISLLQIYRFCPEAPLDSNDAAALAAQLITLKADRELTVTPRIAACCD